MRRSLLSLTLVAAVVVALLVGDHVDHSGHFSDTLPDIVRPSEALAQAGGFLEPFNGAPAAPQPWRPTNWDVQTNVTDSYQGDGTAIDVMQAHHSGACGAPPGTHTINRIDDAIFQCSDHIMTAMSAGYGAIYLTPNAQVDFSGGEASVKFDLSTLRTVGRDWVDLWITPFEDNLVVPLEDWGPAYQGEPRRSVHIRLDGGSAGDTIFKGEVIRDFTATGLAASEWRGYEQFLTPSASRRDTFELRISRTRVRFGMPAYNVWWVDDTIADLGWSRGVVQFSHHSYNPTKGCDEDGNTADEEGKCANTWHWDNVSISPSAPFTILRGSPRLMRAAGSTQATFPAPAPSGAFLRFAGSGDNLEVSFNGGQTWQPARRQAQEMNRTEHWSSYWTPIPAGTTSVRFRGQATWAGPWAAQDLAIFATAAPSGSQPTATATSPAATPTRTPTATPTRTPTSPPAATATATAAPVQVVTFNDRAGQDQPLIGQYPTGAIDWGTGQWWLAGPFKQFTTKSVSLASATTTSGSFRFVTPRRLVRLRMLNGGTGPSTITLSCPGQPTRTTTLSAGQLTTFATNWAGTCTTVTIGSTNAWGTNFDDLELASP
jgi:hypothetical protein